MGPLRASELGVLEAPWAAAGRKLTVWLGWRREPGPPGRSFQGHPAVTSHRDRGPLG